MFFKVDPKKINVDVMSKWITEKLVSLLGFEDDIVINLTLNLFAETVSKRGVSNLCF